nr:MULTISPECIES: universal stress protein [unclassified Massilia]
MVATAFSDRSADPQRRAAMLAAAHASESFEVLSVVAPGAMGRLWQLSSAGRTLWQRARRHLMHQATRLRSAFGVRCKPLLGAGSLARQAMARVDATRPCLVVLGWHAPSWLGRLRNAWTFATVARRSRRPVLVVRNPALRPYARVLVVTDFSEAALGAVQVALRCAPGAHFTLLHALDTGIEGTMRRAGVASHVIERHRQKARTAARAAFGRFVERLELPGTRFSLLMTPHPERVALSVHAVGAAPDLIVVSGRPWGIPGGLPGISATHEALAATSCDLLLVAPAEEGVTLPPLPRSVACHDQQKTIPLGQPGRAPGEPLPRRRVL